ncbi:MAG: hypothetical protein AB7P49_03700, partial [Bdellovibrionales bacterium]
FPVLLAHISMVHADIYYVPPISQNLDVQGLLLRGLPFPCGMALAAIPSPSETELIQFAKAAQENRGRFSPDFFKNPKTKRLYPNTDYYYTRDVNGELSGLLAVTYSYYNRHYNIVGPLLPLEDYLDTRITRPPHHKEGGVVAELRFFTTKPGAYADAILSIRLWAYPQIYKRIQDYNPWFLNQDVLYTYGDDLSIEHYGLKDFRIFSDERILVDGIHWATLVNSPQRLLDYMLKIQSWFHNSRIGEPSRVRMPNERWATFLGGVEYQFRRGQRILKVGYGLADETEIEDGLWVAKGGHVLWQGPHLISAGPLTQPYVFPHDPRIVAMSGHRLILRPGLRPGKVIVDRLIEIAPGIRIQPGEDLAWSYLKEDEWMSTRGGTIWNPRAFNADGLLRPPLRGTPARNRAGLGLNPSPQAPSAIQGGHP